MDSSLKRRFGHAALFGLLAASVGLCAALVTGMGFIFLFPGFVLGMMFGLIPFEGDAIGSYILIATVINFLCYSIGFLCGSLVLSGVLRSNAVTSHGNR